MTDFEEVDIEINHFSDNWGPFVFNVDSASAQIANDGLIPFGSELNSATVRAFVGTINEGALLSEYTEITTELIDTDIPVAVTANTIMVYFKYPGVSYKGKRITIIFEVTLSTTAKQAFFFHSVVIN